MRRLRSPRSKRQERGAALFIVAMVITLLTAIGFFSARAASLTSVGAGFNRQALQTTYVSEYATRAAAADYTTRVDEVTKKVRDPGTPPETCEATKDVVITGIVGPQVVPCYKFFQSELNNNVGVNFAGQSLFETYVPGAPPTPGSLGPVALQANFRVEMTDPGRPGRPVVGAERSDTGGAKFGFTQLAFTTTAQTGPFTPGGTCNASVSTVAGVQSLRAYVTVGPIAQ